MQKTEPIFQFSSGKLFHEPNITANGESHQVVDSFSTFGSILPFTATIDAEINFRILKALFPLIHSFIHAYELMLCLHIFRQTGPSRRLDCLAPPPVCHIKMEASREVSCPRTQQASWSACFSFDKCTRETRY